MASTANLRPSRRYSSAALFLHWSIAVLVVASIALNVAHAPFVLHQFAGIAILLLSFARLALRLTHPLLPLPTVMVGWEKAMARITHVAFYAVMIGIPLFDYFATSHAYAPYAMLALLVMHVCAALKHAYIQNNPALDRRMTVQETAAH